MNETNEVANIPEVPDTLEPLVRALPDWVAQGVVWVLALNVMLAPASVWISHKLRDMLNKAAAIAATDMEDSEDEFLRILFSKTWYRTVSVLLRFVSIDLPTLAELNRAIAFQKEAVVAWQKSDSNPAKSA